MYAAPRDHVGEIVRLGPGGRLYATSKNRIAHVRVAFDFDLSHLATAFRRRIHHVVPRVSPRQAVEVGAENQPKAPIWRPKTILESQQRLNIPRSGRASTDYKVSFEEVEGSGSVGTSVGHEVSFEEEVEGSGSVGTSVGHEVSFEEEVEGSGSVGTSLTQSGSSTNGPGSGNAGGASMSSAIQRIKSFVSAINRINKFFENNPEIRDWIVEWIREELVSGRVPVTGSPLTWRGRKFAGWARTARFAIIKQGRRAGMVRDLVAANAIMHCTDLVCKAVLRPAALTSEELKAFIVRARTRITMTGQV